MVNKHIWILIVIGSLTLFSNLAVVMTAMSFLQLIELTGSLSAYLNIANMWGVTIAGLCLGGLLHKYQGCAIGFYTPILCAILLSFLLVVPHKFFLLSVLFAIAVATGLDNPNINSSLNYFITDERDKASIFALYTTVSQTMVIISPLVASFFIAQIGHYLTFQLIIMTYLLNAALWFFVKFLRHKNIKETIKETAPKKNYWTGYSLLFTIPALRDLTINRILNNVLFTGTAVLLPLMVAKITYDNIQFTFIQSLTLSFIGLGFILNGLLSRYWLKKSPQSVVSFARAATFLAVLAMLISLLSNFNEYALYIMALLLGVGQFYFRLSGMTLGQAVTPNEHLAEVILAGDSLVRGFTALYAIILLYLVNVFGFNTPYLFFIILGSLAPFFITKSAKIYLENLTNRKI